MMKEVNTVEHGIADFRRSGVDAYCELAKVSVSSLGKVALLFLDRRSRDLSKLKKSPKAGSSQ